MTVQEYLLSRVRTAAGDSIELIIKYHGSLAEIAAQTGATAERLNENYAILTIGTENLNRLQDTPGIEYYELPKNVFFQLETLSDAGILPVRQLPLGLTGKGVIVAVIDSGIDFLHPAFRNPDGTTRILYLWDQSEEGSPPSGFAKGNLYTAEDINTAILSSEPRDIVTSLDFIGHGTAVAGIAAGSRVAGNGFTEGVAPEAGIIAVKLDTVNSGGFSRSTDIMRGVSFCIDIAENLDMPIAVNISYGTNDGSHNGTSLFESFMDDESAIWKNIICAASGNEASAGHHYGGKAVQGVTIKVRFAITQNVTRCYLAMWKNFADTFSIELISPSGATTGLITPTDSLTQKRLDSTDVTVLYMQPNNYTASQEIFIEIGNGTDPITPGIGTINIFPSSVVDGRFDIWLPLTDAVSERTAFLNPSPENTATLPSTAFRPLTVGGYDSSLNTVASFSGRGKEYLVYGQKPDIVAPAVNITAPSPGGAYATASGTSFACPFVTGSSALLMQWGIINGNDPFLFGQRIKAFLCRSAIRDFPDTYPNSRWGYGKLNLLRAVEQLILYTER